MERKELKILYHYCSIDSFIKIIETKKLRFSDITKSNDTYEIAYLWKHYYDYLKTHLNKLAVTMSRFTISQQFERSKFVVACFSSEKDSLHMWTSYANDGVSIGFDKHKLDEWVKQICLHTEINESNVKNSASFGKLSKVDYYSKKNVQKFIETQVSGLECSLNGFCDILNGAPFAKTDFFQCESEWRIVLPLIYDNLDKILLDYVNQGQVVETICPKTENKGIFTDCLTYDIPFYKNMISEIYLSPRCKYDSNEIRHLLMINGFNFDAIRIKKSIGSLI